MRADVAAVVAAIAAGVGAYLLYTAVVYRWRGLGPGATRANGSRQRDALRRYLAQAGLHNLRVAEFVAVAVSFALVGGALGWAIWGGVLAPVVVAMAAATTPFATARNRRRRNRELARESWPQMIEEIRLQVTSLGRSVPQALLTVGHRGDEEMRPAFAAAQREWQMSTDFHRTLDALKARLVDPTADAVCETLLIAHEVGGTDVDGRLRALMEDRILDLHGRKDARSKQAGVRFARLFVLIVPLGMALVGLSIGDGRAAFTTALGQLAVVVALAMIGVCWLWASHLLRLPEEERVFVEEQPS